MVVTDNYLKVRVPEGLPDNRRVRVRITGAGESTTSVIVGVPCAARPGPNNRRKQWRQACYRTFGI